MREDYLETFLVGGLGLLVVTTLMIAWLLWQERRARKMSIGVALAGVGYEFVHNLHQVLVEIARLKAGVPGSVQGLVPLAHPQLDGVIAHPMATDKRALSGVHSAYRSLEVYRMRIRERAAHGRNATGAIDELTDSAVHAIATAYLWDRHGGRLPRKARSPRASAVHRWLTSHGFAREAVEGRDLHDAVIRALQDGGTALKPRPISMPALDEDTSPPPEAASEEEARDAAGEGNAEVEDGAADPDVDSGAQKGGGQGPEVDEGDETSRHDGGPGLDPRPEETTASEEPPYPHEPAPFASSEADEETGDEVPGEDETGDLSSAPSRRRRSRRR